jgi:hypothetical protein
MNRVLKTFLLWLLIAVLPIQGMAAVIKASCGPRHHDTSLAVMTVAEHHHDADVGPHQHDSSDVTAATEDVEAAGTASHHSSSAKQIHKASHCSACAACCTGAVAPPSSVSLPPVLSTIEAAPIPPAVSFTGFIPAGLKRPPKHLSA